MPGFLAGQGRRREPDSSSQRGEPNANDTTRTSEDQPTSSQILDAMLAGAARNESNRALLAGQGVPIGMGPSQRSAAPTQPTSGAAQRNAQLAAAANPNVTNANAARARPRATETDLRRLMAYRNLPPPRRETTTSSQANPVDESPPFPASTTPTEPALDRGYMSDFNNEVEQISREAVAAGWNSPGQQDDLEEGEVVESDDDQQNRRSDWRWNGRSYGGSNGR